MLYFAQKYNIARFLLDKMKQEKKSCAMLCVYILNLADHHGKVPKMLIKLIKFPIIIMLLQNDNNNLLKD